MNFLTNFKRTPGARLVFDPRGEVASRFMPRNLTRTVIVIPAGRRRYLELLIPQILDEPGWNELHLWANTTDSQDLDYLRSLDDPRIKVIHAPRLRPNGAKTIGQFFTQACEAETCYIRLDDDICFLEKGVIEKIASARKKDTDSCLISGTVINNALVSYIFQSLGRLGWGKKYLTAASGDSHSWQKPLLAEALHLDFLGSVQQQNFEKYRFADRTISLNRFSINCISWRGDLFSTFGGVIPDSCDEEEWLSVVKPAQLNMTNKILGNALVSHFSFYTQRKHLDRTSILQQYKAAVEQYRRIAIN
jgi:hypothetical protein